MKKIVLVVLVLAFVGNLFVGCGQTTGVNKESTNAETATKATEKKESNSKVDGSSDESTDSDNKEDVPLVDQIFGDIESLDSEVELTIGVMPASINGFVPILIEQLGGYEKTGIKINYVQAGTGSAILESLAADGWDLAIYGIGGAIPGVLRYDTVLLGVTKRDGVSAQFFVKNDNDIATSGESLPGIYGTKDDWMGAEVYAPTGSTLHYVLAKGLEKIGLTEDDIVLNHMAPFSANTALRAGKAEVAGVWGPMPFDPELLKDHTSVMNGDSVEAVMYSPLVARKAAYEDAEKTLAIKKYMELHYALIDWVNDNTDQYTELLYEQTQKVGGIATLEVLKAWVAVEPLTDIETSYKLFTESVETDMGSLTPFNKANYDVLKFFVEKGNYTEEDMKTFLNSGAINSEYLTEIYESMKK